MMVHIVRAAEKVWTGEQMEDLMPNPLGADVAQSAHSTDGSCRSAV
jgi:hypothetical protein